MRKILAVTAAFAAGLTALAASAASASLRTEANSYVAPAPAAAPTTPRRALVSQRADAPTEVRKPAAKPSKAAAVKPAATGKSATTKTAATKIAAAKKPATVRLAAAAKPSVRKPQKSGRERIDLDPTSTASVSADAVVKTVAAHSAYGEMISRYASAYGVPVSLAHAVIRVESNYRPNTRGAAGEIGLMQIKPSTARMMGYSGSAGGLYNPETNIKYGMKYLGMAQELGDGSTCGTILKYNAGHGAKRMNPVSSAYCRKVKTHLVQ